MAASERRVLVFGGSGAVGTAIRAALARDGARVAFTYRSRALEGGIRCDLESLEDPSRAVEAAAKTLGGLDAVVFANGPSSAEIFRHPGRDDNYDRASEISAEEFARMMATHVRGPFLACQTAEKHLVAAGGGNIVFLGSVSGVKLFPLPAHLSAAKGALAGLSESLAKELGPRGIRVNVVAPGLLDCGLTSGLGPALRGLYLKHCSYQRLGRAEEVADAIAFICASNTYMTGQRLVLDGGL